MDEPEGLTRTERFSLRVGQTHPRAVAIVFGSLFLGAAVAAVVAAADGWDGTPAPALALAGGLAGGVGTTYVGWWVWKRDHEVSEGWRLLLWTAPTLGILALASQLVGRAVTMAAYGFFVAYGLGAVVLLVIGLRERGRMSEDEARAASIRSYEWIRGG